MKSQERILLSLSLISLLLVVGLAPFTCGEKAPSYGLDDHAAIGGVTLRVLYLPLFDIATSPPGEVLPVSASSYSVHNLNTSENFSSIQEAIDDSNTNDSHIIEVDPGTYSENVVVNKSVTIRSSSGDPFDTVVEAASANEHVFTVTTDNVTISGFTIEGATGEGKAGIYLDSSNNRILNNILTSNDYGVISLNSVGGTQANYARASRVEGEVHEYATVRDGDAYFNEAEKSDGRGYETIPMEASGSMPMIRDREPQVSSKPLLTNSLPARASSSNNNLIASNNVSSNFIGIAIIGSAGNVISNNLVKSNDDTGIYLDSSNDNVVTNNTASLTRDYSGICIWDSCSNEIVNNNASSNSNSASGIELLGISSDNLIDNNTASSNGGAGIIFWESNDNNMITNNTALYNGYSGIDLLWFSSSNIIKSNIVNSNEGGGITLWEFNDNNTIAHNTASYNKNSSGIQLVGSSNKNTVKNNTANSNSRVGIGLWDSTNNNNVSHNTVHDNKKGVQLTDYASQNSITNNSAKFNADCGVALFVSSSDNTISHNDLSSNLYGLTIISVGGNPSNNYVLNNTISSNNLQGIWLLDIQDPNNISSNTVTDNTIFGIGISQSTNISINFNTANFNEIGIGLLLSDDIQLTDNAADSNRITGFYLWESYNNTIANNTADSNQFEGVYLLNSGFNDISTNTLASSYFGIYLDTASNNTISNNDAASNYYSEVLLYASPGNTLINNTEYIQEEIIYGVRLSVPEIITPSLQVVDNGTNATYSIMVANLGNTPDIFDLTASSDDDPATLSLEPDTVSLAPGEIDFGTINLHVGDTAPGIYRATIEARSQGEPTVKDGVETRTIVRGEVDSESVNSAIEDSALVTSTLTDSSISRSAIINATISGSTITESVITSSVVAGTALHDVTVANAIVTDGVISTGTITINGITYEIDGEERIIADLVIGSDYSDSTLVGIKESKTLMVIAEDSDVDFDISAKDDYFAGSMRVQKAIIPPNGVPELTNAVSDYIYAHVSDNVADSTGWVLVRVYYDRTELGDLDERSLRLMYFDETAEVWEAIPVSGVNPAENYVWANISHYSVFSVSGSVTPKKDRRPGGGGGAHTDTDEDGLTDLQELILGTDRNNTDTDGDGFLDGEDPFPLDPNLPLQAIPTSTPAPTPVPTPQAPEVPTPSPSPATPPIPEEEKPGYEIPTPGFDALVALGGLLVVAYLVLRRRRR